NCRRQRQYSSLPDPGAGHPTKNRSANRADDPRLSTCLEAPVDNSSRKFFDAGAWFLARSLLASTRVRSAGRRSPHLCGGGSPALGQLPLRNRHLSNPLGNALSAKSTHWKLLQVSIHH